ncbi:MAG: polysaccharide pyruvyl transferase family protein [Alphaproteobacteria bacterium]
MKILAFKGTHLNFGDDLNEWLWPRLLPGFFDEDERVVFIGIGSSLGADYIQGYGQNTRKIVFGAGFVPAYNPDPVLRKPPNVRGPDWDVYFVRGPRTAQALNLAPSFSLGDSAILIRSFIDPKLRKPETISFIPHWESLERGNWEEVCRLAGIKLIDPRRSVDDVVKDLMGSKFVIAEAMHGAIVADALRVPWIPVVPMNKIHREKWYDWAEALDIKLAPHKICPSSLEEARLSFMRKAIVNSPLAQPLEASLTHIAAHNLSRLAKLSSCLSDDQVMNSVHERMMEHVYRLKTKEKF